MRNPFKKSPKPLTPYVRVEKPEKKTFQRKVIDVSIEEAITATKEKVSDHFRNNWKLYVTHATTAVVAGTIGGIAAGRKAAISDNFDDSQNATVIFGKQVAKNHSTINNNVTITQTKGHPGNVIEDLATGIKYLSQADAAKAFGVSANTLRKALNDNGGVLKTPEGTKNIVNHGTNTGVKVA